MALQVSRRIRGGLATGASARTLEAASTPRPLHSPTPPHPPSSTPAATPLHQSPPIPPAEAATTTHTLDDVSAAEGEAEEGGDCGGTALDHGLDTGEPDPGGRKCSVPFPLRHRPLSVPHIVPRASKIRSSGSNPSLSTTPPLAPPPSSLTQCVYLPPLTVSSPSSPSTVQLISLSPSTPSPTSPCQLHPLLSPQTSLPSCISGTFLSPSPVQSFCSVPPSPNPSCSSVHCSSSSLSSGSTVIFNLSREASASLLGSSAVGAVAYVALSPDVEDDDDDGDSREAREEQVLKSGASDTVADDSNRGGQATADSSNSGLVVNMESLPQDIEDDANDRSHYERLHDSLTDEEVKNIGTCQHHQLDQQEKESDVRPKLPHQSGESSPVPLQPPPMQQRKYSHEMMPSQRQLLLDSGPQHRKYSLESAHHCPIDGRGAHLQPEHKQLNQQPFPRINLPSQQNLIAFELEKRLLQHQQQTDALSRNNDHVAYDMIQHHAKSPYLASLSSSLPPTLTVSTCTPLLSPQPPALSLQATPTFLLTPTSRSDVSPSPSPYSFPAMSPLLGGSVTPRPRTITPSLLPPPASTSPSPSSPSSLSSCSSSSSSSSLTVAGDIKRRSSHGLDLADISEEPHYENTIIVSVPCKAGSRKCSGELELPSFPSSPISPGGLKSQHNLDKSSVNCNIASFLAKDDDEAEVKTAYENLHVEYMATLTHEGFGQDAVIRALLITHNDINMARNILTEFASKRR